MYLIFIFIYNNNIKYHNMKQGLNGIIGKMLQIINQMIKWWNQINSNDQMMKSNNQSNYGIKTSTFYWAIYYVAIDVTQLYKPGYIHLAKRYVIQLIPFWYNFLSYAYKI